jgi:hypothetical protein
MPSVISYHHSLSPEKVTALFQLAAPQLVHRFASIASFENRTIRGSREIKHFSHLSPTPSPDYPLSHNRRAFAAEFASSIAAGSSRSTPVAREWP